MTISRPKAIPSEGLIGAFSPSDALSPFSFDRLQESVGLLRSVGLGVVFAEHAFDDNLHVTSSIEARAADLNTLVGDPCVHALIATYGGKRANALLPYLDYEALATERKPVIGFSDACVILNAVTAKTGLITFYGPNVLGKLDETDHYGLDELRENGRPFGEIHSASARTIYPGDVQGRLVGGNLSTFTVSVADTPYEPRFDEVILIWETSSGEWRLIDQYLAALEIRGVMSRVRGQIIGKIGDGDNEQDDEFLRARMERYAIPTLRLPIFGHGPAENPIWPIGGLVQVNATRGTVRFLEQCIDDD